ncbi:YhgE/Pip family protein [Anaerosporobacter sp.]
MNKQSNKKRFVPYVILLGVVIIPLLYSYFYLGAFWDPYAKLDNVPVAVVNEDTGATINDKSRNLGQEMCDNLKENASLKFSFTDEKTAKDGLKKNDYYAIIVIPDNFSQDIATTSSTNKQTATITYSSNEKTNYLASQILNNAVAKIEKSLRSSIDNEIVSTLSDQLTGVPGQLQSLSDGLSTIENGASDLSDGTSKLSDASKELHTGTDKLATATDTLKEGTSSLSTGSKNLQSGIQKILAGGTTLNQGLGKLSKNIKTFQSGIKSASKGSTTLESGIINLDSGIDELLKGAKKLEAGTSKLDDLKNGADSLSTGAATLLEGINTYTAGVDTLLDTVTTLTTTLSQYAATTDDATIKAIVTQLTTKENLESMHALQNASATLKQGAASLKSGTQTLSSGTQNLATLKDGITSIKEGLTTAKKGSAALATGANNLQSGLSKLNKASTKLVDGTNSLYNGSNTLSDGLGSLSTGINSLTDGATKLDNGASRVNDGANTLNDGTSELVSGTSTLDDGAQKLTDGIQTANDKVNDSLSKASDKISSLDGLNEYASDPVTIESDAYAPVPNYGTAFAPYFMSLSLYVGGLMIFFGIYFDPDNHFNLLSRKSTRVIKRSFAYLIIGLLQAILLCIVLSLGLGLKVENIPLYVVSCCLVSMVFISIIQLLLLFFSNVGKFLAIALLIIQLASCGGTFPMETLPKFYNIMYPFMPMTYSVGLFKEAISGVGDTSLILKNVLVLLAILVVVMGITVTLALIRKNKKEVMPTETDVPVL